MEINERDFYNFIVELLDDTEGISQDAMNHLNYLGTFTSDKDVKSVLHQTVKVKDRYFLRAGWIR